MTPESFAAVALAFNCPFAPAVQKGRLWVAEGTVGRVCPLDETEEAVRVVGRSPDEANALYRDQVAMIAREKAPLLRAYTDDQRAQVERNEAALFALAQG